MASKRNRPIIAIVDDDALVGRSIMHLLRSWGMDAATFTWVDEFIDVLEATPPFDPDCVILDVWMPGLNGFLVQQYLAARRPGIPVILASADSDARTRERALAAGAAAFFPKPFDADSLVRTLQGVLRSASAGKPGA